MRSKAFFIAIKNKIPTEQEFLNELKLQDRFDEDKYNEDVTISGQKVNKAILEMNMAENEKALTQKLEECLKHREELKSIISFRQQFLQHTAESKANNEYNMALMGACIFDSNKNPSFGSRNLMTGRMNISEAYDSIKNHEDFAFISKCISVFIPFSAGILNPDEINPEYITYTDKRKKLGLKDDDITIEVKEYKKRIEFEDNVDDVKSADIVSNIEEDIEEGIVEQVKQTKTQLKEAQVSLFDEDDKDLMDIASLLADSDIADEPIIPKVVEKQRQPKEVSVIDETEDDPDDLIKMNNLDTYIGDGSGLPSDLSK